MELIDVGETKTRLPGTSAEIVPKQLVGREPFTVKLEGWAQHANSAVDVCLLILCQMSSLDYRPLTVQLDASGNGSIEVAAGIDVEGIWSVYVESVQIAGRAFMPGNNPATLINSGEEILSAAEIQSIHHELRAENDKLFHSSAIGDPSDPTTKQHRVVTLLMGVLTTQSTIYPGLVTIPLDERPVDKEHAEILNSFMRSLSMDVHIDAQKWASSKSNRYPTTAVYIPQIWAQDFDEAHRIALEMIDRLRLVLAMNRLAAATPAVLTIEQRQPDDRSKWHVYPYEIHYGGNLLGGFLSGESPEVLVHSFEKLAQDPLVRLSAGLFAEAIAEKSTDFRFFKYWSALEALSERYEDDGSVGLLSGKSWPEKVGPQDPGPGVYSMLARMLLAKKIHEGSFTSPAVDLYEFVQALKGRRNATAHYGGSDSSSSAQKKRKWFAFAKKSERQEEDWLRSARDACVAVINFALEDDPTVRGPR